jgi:hypothetical protein
MSIKNIKKRNEDIKYLKGNFPECNEDLSFLNLRNANAIKYVRDEENEQKK